ncbi:hypothetical protein BASA50_006542 [Batrachochytrium salamandrivorans]|uniref:Tail specific protease domain-containing protein n=1 Tax=Batrachochytrium salamandrivorans TaxID=1357716 RepID=A0ABQ8FA64_9FUNG|nr:hypothetical protein BASA50_006542 [Batrachochytrium salamandrivorans]KAH9270925.1 hypothetical protein BASA83_006879 [Batrachochytrium salamandrivorans]
MWVWDRLLLIGAMAIALTKGALTSTSIPKTYNKIQDDRDNDAFSFVPYSKTQQDDVLNNAESLLKVWVNQDTNKDAHRILLDSFQTIESLRDRVDTTNDESFLLDLMDMFHTLRDPHTSIRLPGPYGCFSATTGFVFQIVNGMSEEDKAGSIPHSADSSKISIVLAAKTNVPEILNLLNDEFSEARVGDELVLINDMSFIEWYKANKDQFGRGANKYDSLRRAIAYLGTINGATHRLPEANQITLVFRSRNSHASHLYTLEVPYVSVRNDECWALSSNLYKEITKTTLPGTPKAPKKSKQDALPQHSHQKIANTIRDQEGHPMTVVHVDSAFPDYIYSPVKWEATSLPHVFWTIWNQEKLNLGIIRIADFSLDQSKSEISSLLATGIIRNLLTTVLRHTTAVLFDVRGNPGGTSAFAESLSQLFRSNVNPSSLFYMRNDITRTIFVQGEDPNESWVRSWDASNIDDKYTEPMPLVNTGRLGTFGQAFLRPVGVLTDSNCFSSCELFAASMQDTASATLFGEDGQTGGGGTSVYRIYPFLNEMDPASFKLDPYTSRLTSPTSGEGYFTQMAVSLRQVLRKPQTDKKIMSGNGVEADVIVRSSAQDTKSNVMTSTVYDRIGANLKEKGKMEESKKPHFVLEPYSFDVYPGSVQLRAESQGIDLLEILDSRGKSIAREQVIPGFHGELMMSIWPGFTNLGSQRITIVGTRDGEQVLKTYREINVVPQLIDHYKVTEIPVFFEGLSFSDGIYHSHATQPKDGWNCNESKCTIGTGASYAKNVESELRMYLSAPIGTQLQIAITADMNTRPTLSSMRLVLHEDSGDSKVIKVFESTSSGKDKSGKPQAEMIRKIIPFVCTTQHFSIHLQFSSSDGASSGYTGVILNSLSVVAIKA